MEAGDIFTFKTVEESGWKRNEEHPDSLLGFDALVGGREHEGRWGAGHSMIKFGIPELDIFSI